MAGLETMGVVNTSCVMWAFLGLTRVKRKPGVIAAHERHGGCMQSNKHTLIH